MPYVTADNGVRLYCEETGQRTPVLLCDEFFDQVESGQYRMRDPRAQSDHML